MEGVITPEVLDSWSSLDLALFSGLMFYLLRDV